MTNVPIKPMDLAPKADFGLICTVESNDTTASTPIASAKRIATSVPLLCLFFFPYKLLSNLGKHMALESNMMFLNFPLVSSFE